MSQAWQIFVLCNVVLYLKFFGVAAVQGVERMRHRAFVNPEDAAFFGKGATPVARERELAERAQRTLRNDLENIPFFFALGLLYLHSEAWPPGAAIYFPLFTASRIVHSLAYLRPTQPLRNRAYLVGVLVLLAMCGHLVAAAL